MEQRPRSQTAEIAAALRVWHTRLDDAPTIFDDRAVLPLLSPRMRQLVQPPPPLLAMQLRTMEGMHPELAALRGQTVTRARFAEDALDAAVDRGHRQIVLLGAGLDTTALRRPDLLARTTLLEVDQAPMQWWKRAHLPAKVANRMRFVAVDFARDRLAERLLDARIDPQTPLFANWMGCTYYLPPEAIGATLQGLAEVAAPGSELVADYWLPAGELSWRPRMLLRGVELALNTQQEPLLGLIRPDTLHRLAANTGWQVLEELDAPALRAHWLSERRDSLSVPAFARCLRLVRD
ncbi:class I SAM-dependent methyltransferase [Halorhodospira halophila]|uniref:S-adenosyl-L-methionine-dependent methyltransferase n=1 Tax=Halorhodospira halophila (strain DSM 244 / SL1) TaxID=349124 RepID=A1WTH0_HALHL|nr:class I SAM-dependent methyltransferase [Halorhodospira halophila]ABM60982.1 putative methyltransferase [Halorhodospira halophila SL1]MBK1728640.1 SAM-dependent methyltransferase [Halorhodospira halophila]